MSWAKTYLASLPQVKHDKSRFWKRAVGVIPAPLVVVAASTIAVRLLGLESMGVSIVGNVPSGLPSVSNPFSNDAENRAAEAEGLSVDVVPSLGDDLQALLPAAAVTAGLGILELVSVGKGAESLYDLPIDVTQEMVGVGTANIAASFVGGFPVTGSFSRSSVNADAGARTPMSSWVTASFLAIVLVYLTELFFFLPQVTLGVMIMYAVLKQFDQEVPRMLWAVDKRDMAVFVATFLATACLGVQNGLAVGAVLSLGRLLQESAAPRVARLGRSPGTRNWINFGRHSDHSKEEPGVAVLRFESHLYFANAVHFRDEVLRAAFPWRKRDDFKPITMADYNATPAPPAAPIVPGMGPALPPEAVIFDCSPITRVDASAVDVLESIPREVKRHAKRLREQRVQRLRRALEELEDAEAKARAARDGHNRLCVCETTKNEAGEEFMTCRLECSCVLRSVKGCFLGFTRFIGALVDPWMCCLECPCCVPCGGRRCVQPGGCCGKEAAGKPDRMQRQWSWSTGVPGSERAASNASLAGLSTGGIPAPTPSIATSMGFGRDEELAVPSLPGNVPRSQSLHDLVRSDQVTCGGAVSSERSEHMGEMTQEFL